MRKQLLNLYLIAGVLPLLLLTPFALSSTEEVSLFNTSRYLGHGRWNWTIFVGASKEVLKNIKCVEYTLDSTYFNRIQVSLVRLKNEGRQGLMRGGRGAGCSMTTPHTLPHHIKLAMKCLTGAACLRAWHGHAV